MCACVRACVRACLCLCVCMCMCVCVCVCTCTCTRDCMCVHVYTRIGAGAGVRSQRIKQVVCDDAQPKHGTLQQRCAGTVHRTRAPSSAGCCARALQCCRSRACDASLPAAVAPGFYLVDFARARARALARSLSLFLFLSLPLTRTLTHFLSRSRTLQTLSHKPHTTLKPRAWMHGCVTA